MGRSLDSIKTWRPAEPQPDASKLAPGPLSSLIVALLCLAAVVLLSNVALAQRDGGARRGDRNVAGAFDYYTLVLSWSPTHCATSEGEEDVEQCGRQDGRRYAFVLHGLWPQYEQGFPERCPTRRKPYVPEAVIDSVADVMPSKRLVIHEYRTHGTCSGLDAKDYFELSRRLFEKIEVPERYRNPFEALFVAPEELIGEFVELNSDLTPEMLAVSCGGPGNRLRDVRICFTKDGAFRACGGNEDRQRLCRARSMYVPPVRSTKSGPLSAEDRERIKAPPLPRPQLIEGPRTD
jgi:ribonuclease T2